MPRTYNPAKARQAAFESLVEASGALVVRYRTDEAQRGEVSAEHFEHPALGKRENQVMVPVALLNRMACAVALISRAMGEPPAKPAAMRACALRADGLDC